MKAFLLYRDRDFDMERKLPRHAAALTQDLELPTLFNSMARGDKFILRVVNQVVLSSVADPDAIVYRQDVLRDCFDNAAVIRGAYDLAVEAIEKEKKGYWGLSSRYPSSILHGAVESLQTLIEMLKRLRRVADEHAGNFQSEGFVTLFAMLRRELGDDYFGELRLHLKRLKFRNGVLISAELGKGSRGTSYILRKPHDSESNWVKRMADAVHQIVAETIFAKPPPAYTFFLHPRDEAGTQALSALRDRGINLVANALAQSKDHIISFFTMLRTELAFYVGCLKLRDELVSRGGPICFPVPLAQNERCHRFVGLYNASLALVKKDRVVGNDLVADGKELAVITGANQGGKSTFLCGIGLAQVMMQSGMIVPAQSFSANVCDRLFTHYKREEDTTMESGKFDEELSRMSDIVDDLTPNSMVLFNESFAATNEREGSEIARQVIRALLEKRVKMFFVTHFFNLANGLWEKGVANAIFLRAERESGGGRTFKLVVGEPFRTSFGEDLYRRIFAPDGADGGAARGLARPPFGLRAGVHTHGIADRG